MGVKLNTGLGGSITIDATNTASNVTATLPAVSGTVQVQNNMPSFKARPTSGGQSFTSNVFTKVTLGTEDWDTASCFDTSTSRFTPNVAGYYQISGSVGFSASVTLIATVYKNGSIAMTFFYGNSCVTSCGSGMLYMNGTTDYIELYGRSGTTTTIDVGGGDQTWFSASLVRLA